MINRLFGFDEALFSPSKARPPVMAPSPITAMTWRSFSPFKAEATDIPKAAEIELEACPAIKASYSLSEGFGKPLIPPNLRSV